MLKPIITASVDSALIRLSYGCIERMSTHLNRVSGELPKEIVPTEINRVNPWLSFEFVIHLLPFIALRFDMSCVNRPAFVEATETR